MIALIFWFRRLWPYALGVIISAVLSGAVVHALRLHDDLVRLGQHLADRDTIIAARSDTAAARTKERRADSSSVTAALTKARADTAWKHDTVYVTGDTTPRYAVPIATIVQHDTAFARCERLNSSCAREHLADSATILELRTSLALARTGNAVPPPEKPTRRWSLGVTAGWGALVERDTTHALRVHTGPSITAGGSFRVF